MSRRKKKRDAKVKSLQEGTVLQSSDEALPIQTSKTTKDGKIERTLYPPTINPVLGVNAQLLGEGG